MRKLNISISKKSNQKFKIDSKRGLQTISCRIESLSFLFQWFNDFKIFWICSQNSGSKIKIFLNQFRIQDNLYHYYILEKNKHLVIRAELSWEYSDLKTDFFCKVVSSVCSNQWNLENPQEVKFSIILFVPFLHTWGMGQTLLVSCAAFVLSDGTGEGE